MDGRVAEGLRDRPPSSSRWQMPTGPRLHQLNSVLLLLSAIAAVSFPFETLLLSYAILGPLHYLTEISWLHDRQYFLKERIVRQGLWVGLVVLVLAFGALPLPWPSVPKLWKAWMLYAVFAAVPVGLFVSGWGRRAAALAGLLLLAWLLQGAWFERYLTLYLFTLVHVFVFTGIFMWNGIRARPDRSGWTSMALFLLLPIICLTLPIGLTVAPTAWARQSYGEAFAVLNLVTLAMGGVHVDAEALFSSPVSIQLTRFIAFAYTYHYLNWFSKPSVIAWHRISAGRWFLIGCLWVAAMAIYAWNYMLGFILLNVLSFSHVVLEFPLNHLSFRQFFRGFRASSMSYPVR